MEYKKYLKSVGWKRTRNKKTGKRFCCVCGSKKKLNLHHKTYKRIGEEDTEKDLIWLCEKHHKELHDFAKIKGLNYWKATEEFIQIKSKETKKKKLQRKLELLRLRDEGVKLRKWESKRFGVINKKFRK